VTEMTRHLLLGMVAPLGLALAAPVTLLLRSSGARVRRIVGRLLRSALLRVVSHPVVAASLSTGGLYLVMLTPLAEMADERPWLHLVVHLHYLAAGYLFTWSIAGPDPAPHRPGLATASACCSQPWQRTRSLPNTCTRRPRRRTFGPRHS